MQEILMICSFYFSKKFKRFQKTKLGEFVKALYVQKSHIILGAFHEGQMISGKVPQNKVKGSEKDLTVLLEPLMCTKRSHNPDRKDP